MCVHVYVYLWMPEENFGCYPADAIVCFADGPTFHWDVEVINVARLTGP